MSGKSQKCEKFPWKDTKWKKKGSLGKVETYPVRSKDLGYIIKDEFVQLEELRKEIGRLFRG